MKRVFFWRVWFGNREIELTEIPGMGKLAYNLEWWRVAARDGATGEAERDRGKGGGNRGNCYEGLSKFGN